MGKTQKQIAAELGISKYAVCRYEKGQRDGNFIKLENLLKAYGFRIVGPDQEWNEFEEQ